MEKLTDISSGMEPPLGNRDLDEVIKNDISAPLLSHPCMILFSSNMIVDYQNKTVHPAATVYRPYQNAIFCGCPVDSFI